MPTKKSQQKKSEHISEESDNYEDEEEPYNSEDDYASESDNDESSSQSGGDTDVEPNPESEPDTDNSSIDIDPDDEKDPNEDDRYDPINENEELEDVDEETDIDDEKVDEDVEDVEEAGDIDEEGADADAVGDEDFAAETKPCHLKNLNKDFMVLDEDDSNMYAKMEYKKIEEQDRETDSIMTYYEMVRIIGTRAQQFNLGAEPLVKGLEGLHPAKMAYVELISKMTPFIIRRHLPGKKYEEWRIDELDIIHEISDDFFVPEKFDWDALMSQVSEINKPREIEIITSSRISSKKKISKNKRPKSKSDSKPKRKSNSKQKISRNSGSKKSSRK